MSLLSRLRTGFVAGLLLVTPLAVTVFVLSLVFDRLTGILDPIVTATRLAAYTNDVHVVAQLLAAVLLVALLTLLGLVASWQAGERLFGSFERAIRFVPVVRTIYFGVRQVGESLVSRSEAYESVVLVAPDRAGIYQVGFVTNESPQAVQAVSDDPLYNVFVPNSPNPTAGRLVLVPEPEVHEVEMPVRRGLRLLVTTGLTVDDIDEEALPDSVSEGTGDGATPPASRAGS
jgi:uncharacterized membrane protein